MLEFDWYNPDPPQACPCCGGNKFQLTRFVSKDGDAYAIIFISFTDNHVDRLVKFAVSLGELWPDSSLSRRCFTIWYKYTPDAYGFMMCDPADGDWQDVKSLGRQLTRDEALKDHEVKAVWDILDRVVMEDPILHPHLCKGSAG